MQELILKDSFSNRRFLSQLAATYGNHLRRLDLQATYDFCSIILTALASAHWPKLEHLSIGIRDECSLLKLAKWECPRLQTLALRTRGSLCALLELAEGEWARLQALALRIRDGPCALYDMLFFEGYGIIQWARVETLLFGGRPGQTGHSVPLPNQLPGEQLPGKLQRKPRSYGSLYRDGRLLTRTLHIRVRTYYEYYEVLQVAEERLPWKSGLAKDFRKAGGVNAKAGDEGGASQAGGSGRQQRRRPGRGSPSLRLRGGRRKVDALDSGDWCLH